MQRKLILKEATQQWYMNLPRFSITGYQNMTHKLVHQFSASKHCKVSTTNLFNVRQDPNESLPEYLVWFNNATIKVVNPKQELFAGAFQNGLLCITFQKRKKKLFQNNDILCICTQNMTFTLHLQ